MLDTTQGVPDDFAGIVDEGGAILTDPDAERALLGYMLVRTEEIEKIGGAMRADDLSDTLHRNIFGQLCKAYDEGREIEPKVIAAGLGGDPNAKINADQTVMQYVAALMAGADIEVDPIDLAEHLVDVSERRATSIQPEVYHEPFQSKFGLVMWADQNQPGPEYEYLIEDLIPKGEGVLLMGETQTGKSFLTNHMAMCGARGVPFFGRRILQPFGVIWCAYEAARGQTARMRAYRKYHGLDLEDLPFAVLTRPLALWPDPKACEALIQEMRGIQRSHFGNVPLGMVVFDTYNAATPGASEIDSQIVSQIRQQFDRFRAELGCTTVIVGHTNALGKHRGNEQLTNNIDTVIVVSRKMLNVKDGVEEKDEDGRPVRTMKIKKQREGQDGEQHEFVLRIVEDGTRNAFGRVRTSCVVAPPHKTDISDNQPEAVRPDDGTFGVKASKQEMLFLQCVMDATDSDGVVPPAEIGLPRSIGKVVEYDVVKRLIAAKMLREEDNSDEGRKRYLDRVKKANKRAREYLQHVKVVGCHDPYIWWTGKPVRGVKATQPKSKDMFSDPRDGADEFYADDDFGDFK